MKNKLLGKDNFYIQTHPNNELSIYWFLRWMFFNIQNI